MEFNKEEKKKKKILRFLPVWYKRKLLDSICSDQHFKQGRHLTKVPLAFPVWRPFCVLRNNQKVTFLLEQFRLHFTHNQLALLPACLLICTSVKSWAPWHSEVLIQKSVRGGKNVLVPCRQLPKAQACNVWQYLLENPDVSLTNARRNHDQNFSDMS